MIIVSQDKTKIVNFDNIAHIFISKDSEKHFLIEYGKMTGTSGLLGVYSTEKRAKEVLQEIISRYEYAQRNLADSNDTSPFNEVFVYKMPLE